MSNFEKSFCAENQCCNCCTNMKMIVNVGDLLKYVNSLEDRGINVHLIPVPSSNPADVVRRAISLGNRQCIVFQSEMKRSYRKNPEPKSLSELNNGKQIMIVINGDCLNLIRDSNNQFIGKCSAFKLDTRLPPCSTFVAGSKNCADEIEDALPFQRKNSGDTYGQWRKWVAEEQLRLQNEI